MIAKTGKSRMRAEPPNISLQWTRTSVDDIADRRPRPPATYSTGPAPGAGTMAPPTSGVR